jgi:hypothetical protein
MEGQIKERLCNTMKPFVWQEGMNAEETKDGAYWERNMLVLLLANQMNQFHREFLKATKPVAGWFNHQGEGFEGWSRVVSLGRGTITFHVPDDFDLGDLLEIEPNWDGHSTDEKWLRVMKTCGCK